MLCLILGTVGVALVFHGQHRYRFPVDSLCIVIAAGGLVWAKDAIAGHSLRPSLAALGGLAVRHRIPIGLTAAGIIGLSAWWAFDQDQIERYRDRECRSRLAAIGQALSRYRDDHGRPPAGLADLVPKYLPYLDALHCPKHSLPWHDYMMMGSSDLRAASNMISYRLEGGPGAFRVVEDRARHFGRRNGVGPGEGTGTIADAGAGTAGPPEGYDE
jgi:hypothetical protein